MTTKFENHIAVVTGASTGIGFCIAQALIAQGAKRVYITGRSAKSLHEAAAQLGDAAVAIVSDVSSLSDLEKLRIRSRRTAIGWIPFSQIPAFVKKTSSATQTTRNSTRRSI